MKNIRKPIPHAFVLEELEKIHPFTKPMFGCTAVYSGDKFLFILRDRDSAPRDNGLWIATTKDHHESLKKDFPIMRSIEIFESGVTSWQNLPAESEDFEESVLRLCKLILRDDPRIGTIPKAKKKLTKKKLINKKTTQKRRSKKK